MTNRDRWIRKRKQIIKYHLGSCCQLCGYGFIQEALDLHHYDPKDKLWSVQHALSTETRTRIEAPKLVLVCSNCHRGIHHGQIESPKPKNIDWDCVDFSNVGEVMLPSELVPEDILDIKSPDSLPIPYRANFIVDKEGTKHYKPKMITHDFRGTEKYNCYCHVCRNHKIVPDVDRYKHTISRTSPKQYNLYNEYLTVNTDYLYN